MTDLGTDTDVVLVSGTVETVVVVERNVETVAGVEAVVEVVESEEVAEGVVTIEVVGPPGPPGPVRATYPHRQATAAAEWPVEHMLGYPSEPTVLLDSAPMRPVWVDVVHLDNDRAIIVLPQPESGWAYF